MSRNNVSELVSKKRNAGFNLILEYINFETGSFSAQSLSVAFSHKTIDCLMKKNSCAWKSLAYFEIMFYRIRIFSPLKLYKCK